MIRVFIIDDHKVTADGLKSYFRPSRDEVRISIISTSIEDALLNKDKDAFDVILLDLSFPGRPDFVENFKTIENRYPGKPIIIYTSAESVHWQKKMFNIGAKGYLTKQADKLLIENTIKRVLQGEIVYTPLMTEYQTQRKIEGHLDPKYALSPDQIKMINYYIEGKPTREVAENMFKTISAVNKAMVIIREKFDVKNNIELVVKIINLKSVNPLAATDPTE